MGYYHKAKDDFIKEFDNDSGETIIQDLCSLMNKKYNSGNDDSEVKSWRSSLEKIRILLDDARIQPDSDIILEYNIPATNRRIDFIITGYSDIGIPVMIICEIKNWGDTSTLSLEYKNEGKKDGVIHTIFDKIEGDGEKIEKEGCIYPCYQALTYKELLYDAVDLNREGLIILPCVYLYNCGGHKDIDKANESKNCFNDNFYKEYRDKTNNFLYGEENKFRDFINENIHKGDVNNGQGLVIDLVKNHSRSSLKKFSNQLVSYFKPLADKSIKNNSDYFDLIDSQKIIHEEIILKTDEYLKPDNDNKLVIIVEGGTGTGKTVMALRLLHDMLEKNKDAVYVTKTNAPRNVILKEFLIGKIPSSFFYSHFKSCKEIKNGKYDMIIVDEAHRLYKENGITDFKNNLGNNQIYDIIKNSKISVFFVDNMQHVSLSDIGTIDNIKLVVQQEFGNNTDLVQKKLDTQFRYYDGGPYLEWLKGLLQIGGRKAYKKPTHLMFDFEVIVTPSELKRKIDGHRKNANLSLMVAGLCWERDTNHRSSNTYDINLEQGKFVANWNNYEDPKSVRSKHIVWALGDEEQLIGCIHTAQGQEFDYVGVIIGDDLKCITKGGEDIIIANPIATKSNKQVMECWDAVWNKEKHTNYKYRINGKGKLTTIIKNTYWTLMTRGMKGCYVYACDDGLREYLKKYSK